VSLRVGCSTRHTEMDVQVKAWWKSKTVLVNAAAAVVVFYMPEAQLKELIASLPLVNQAADEPAKLLALLGCLVNIYLRTTQTNQPVTVAAALKPPTPDVTVSTDAGTYLVQRHNRNIL
jgi:hypothetical protein